MVAGEGGTSRGPAGGQRGRLTYTVTTVVGARPQFIKAAVVSRALARIPGIRERWIHTGQHYDPELSQLFFDELAIPPPEVNLGVGSGPHATQTARMLEGIEKVFDLNRPDMVLVYGDTNSTLAAALVASKVAIPVAHIEAGLRSFDRSMPEEVNRLVADRLSTLWFPPTEAARANLVREGLGGVGDVEVVGDVMYDALVASGADRPDPARLARQGVVPGRYALFTAHRAGNTDRADRLAALVGGARALGAIMPVLWPLHPRTGSAMAEAGLTIGDGDGVRIVPPLGYFDTQSLVAGAAVVVTDSGGLQKEAYWHRVPCVTLRDETEWIELLGGPWNRLVRPLTAEGVRTAALAAIAERPSEWPPFYGDGQAARRIAARIERWFAEGQAGT